MISARYKTFVVGTIIINSLLFAIFGLLYLTSPGLMPYHEAFLGKTSSDIRASNPKIFELMIIFMRVIGWLFLSYVFISLYALYLYTKEDSESLIPAITIGGLIIGLPLLQITMYVGAPWQLVLLGDALYLLLLIMYFAKKRR